MMGLLLVSTAVPIVVVDVVVVVVVPVECCCSGVRLSCSTPTAFVIVLIAGDGLEEFVVVFEAGSFDDDHELQVSQPSAERVDKRQQDQRFPLHRPA